MAKALAASPSLAADDRASFYEEASIVERDSQSWVILVDRNFQYLNTLRPFEPASKVPRAQGAPFVSSGLTVFFTLSGPVLRTPVACVQSPELRVATPRYNVGVCFDPARFQALLEQSTFPKDSFGGIVSSDGLVMARSRETAKWLGKPAAKGLLARIKAGQAGFAESVTLEGIASFVYLTPPNRYGWRTSIAMPLTGFASAARRVTLQAVTAAGMLLVIGLMLALYAARRIARPITALRDAAYELGREATPAKLKTGVDEADEVSAALHAAGVRSQEATAMLERRVAEAVSEAREAQAKLLEGRKHEAIGRLTGGLAHDFNNLLQTIRTGLQVMEMTATDGQRRVLESSTRATNKAAVLIRQMLAFGRTTQLAPQAVDFRDFMLKTQDLASKALGAKITLSAHVDTNTPGIFVDPTQLELALLNLVFNARDAMPAGGSIEISAAQAQGVDIGAVGQCPVVRIDVVDNGLGMSKDVQSRALEPYFTTKAVGSGSGLGLAQVAGFVKQSGGELKLESATGAGTRVTLFLPGCELPTGAPVERAVKGISATVPLRVLMVEDDLLVSSVVVPALESAGHSVTLCLSADEAQSLLSGSASFDVLFTDVVMPGKLTGTDLAAWCQANAPRTDVVVATGYTTQQAEGAVTLLHKPYEMSSLLAALQNAAMRRVDATV